MSLDYKSAGVDKEAGYDTVARIKQYAGATHNARVLGQIGAFGAFYDLSDTALALGVKKTTVRDIQRHLNHIWQENRHLLA